MNKALLLLFATLLPGNDARAILEEVERRSQFTSQEHEAKVLFTERYGAASEKRWTLRSAGAKGNRKVLIRFTYPPEVRGVALLILNQPRGPALQWMWVPSIGRDRKIASQDRATSVFGTDLTFEDLEERSLTNFDARLEGESAIDGILCHRVVTVPREARGSSYSSSVLWVDKKRFIVLRVENRRDSKTVRLLRFSDLRDVQGILTPHTLEATNEEAGSRTLLKLHGVRHNMAFHDSDFTREALRTPR